MPLYHMGNSYRSDKPYMISISYRDKESLDIYTFLIIHLIISLDIYIYTFAGDMPGM